VVNPGLTLEVWYAWISWVDKAAAVLSHDVMIENGKSWEGTLTVSLRTFTKGSTKFHTYVKRLSG